MSTSRPAPGDAVGPYRLLRRLGRGGMGEVWLVQHPAEAQGRNLALKMLSTALDDPRERARLRRERQLLARVEHRCVARVVDAGETATGTPYYVMESVDGRPLDQYCEEERCSLTERVTLLLQVCDAVAEAHRQLVIHCDLKPSNILVLADGTPKLLDFGIARWIQGDDAADGRVTQDAGFTPAYASPELLEGRPVGVTADVYSLGVLLSELCFGRRPESSAPTGSQGSMPPIAPEQAASCRTSPTRLAREVRGDLGAVLKLALAADPRDRTQSVHAFAQDLQRWLAGLPVSARRSGSWTRLRAWTRRHRRWAAAIALSLFTLTAWLVFAASEYVQARAARASSSALEQVATERASTADRALSAARRMADVQLVADLERRAREAWSLRDASLQEIDEWLVEAESLRSRRSEHRETLAALRPAPPQARLLASHVETAWRQELIVRLVAGIDRLTDDDPRRVGTIAEMKVRRQRAASLVDESIEQLVDRWEEAAEDVEFSGRYPELSLAPQLGLIPLGLDPTTDLLECAVLYTGSIPTRDATTEQLALDASSAIVLVLLPEGPNRQDPKAPLRPFFLAKHELTQAQWWRLTSERPTAFDVMLPTLEDLDLHPVDMVAYDESREVFARYGLRHPTESEWEHGYRGECDTPWWCGDTPSSIGEQEAGNVADQFAKREGPGGWGEYEPWSDGHVAHAPVGSFRANDYGLFDVLGNVAEWGTRVTTEPGEISTPEQEANVQLILGGSFMQPASVAIATWRDPHLADSRVMRVGVRPARDLHVATPSR